MEQFAHLRLVSRKTGIAVIPGGGGESEETKDNKADRQGHSSKLQRWITDVNSIWEKDFSEREEKQLAPLDEEVVTAFFQINPNLLLPGFDLESFGIEIISEEEDGYIIGASADNFRTLEEKIAGFINKEYSTGKIADLWQIFSGDRQGWRAEHILSEELFARWGDIRDDDRLKLEVSIAFAKPLGKEPDPNIKGGEKRLAAFHKQQEERDDALLKRQIHFENFVSFYGTIQSSIIELGDCFCALVEISGKGLKDLVQNYPFVFEVVEIDEAHSEPSNGDGEDEDELEILQPVRDAPIVGLIDSGVMENHKYLQATIDHGRSISYIDLDPSTADHVPNGGHGTKVAGAIVFPQGVSSIVGSYSPPCYIRNLRILDARNSLQEKYPADLMHRIIDENEDCKLYNLSVASRVPYRLKHMSSWAAAIDKLTHEKDVLFVVSVGNILSASMQDYLQKGEIYPDYLTTPFCRIANPAQSSFAISVGSVDHADFEDVNWKSVASKDSVSAYSRVGHGIWGHIKPDLVEYGGGVVASKDGVFRITSNPYTSIELPQSTIGGVAAIGKSSFGTSFSTPKITHIAAILKRIYPDEGVNLIRALLVQGARLPGDLFYNPTMNAIRQLGYGIPSLNRVIRNTDYRATFYATDSIAATAAHLYSLRIPESLRSPGNEFDILIEVTLSYTAKVRRTRQRLKSYLGTWLDWTSSKLNDSFESFSERAIKQAARGAIGDENPESAQVIQWKIRERSDWGNVRGINRNHSSLQKDWVILKSYQLPEELSFAVRGHKGWDKSLEQIPYALAVSIEVLGSEIPVYEEINAENQVELEVENEVAVWDQ